MVVDCFKALVELPQPKALINMRVDYKVQEFFRNQGKGYRKTS